VSTRLALDADGRRIAIVTAPDVGLEVGMRFVVLANEVGSEVRFTGTPTGQLNTVTAPRKSNSDPLPVDA
jgi:hypothetical protein